MGGDAARAAYIPDFKRGRVDMAACPGELTPTTIRYDIDPPYDDNWAFYRQTRELPEAQPHHFIVTTTNARILESLAGRADAIEFVGRPFDLAEIIDRVAAAMVDLDA
jgi:CheY-like chemotaxis protein